MGQTTGEIIDLEYPAAGAQEADGSDDTPEAIEARIAQTRSELGNTIDALQEKLSPERVKEQVTEQVKEQVHEHVQAAKEAVHDATIGKAEQIMHNASEAVTEATRPVVEAVSHVAGAAMGSAQSAASSVADTGKDTVASVQNTTVSVLETLRQNPLATALAAVGIGMLVMNSSQRSSSTTARTRTTTAPSYRDRYTDTGPLTGAKETLKDVAGHTQEAAGHLADQAREKVHDLGHVAHDQKHLAEARVNQTVQDSPLAAGIVALALGAAVGLLAPGTEPEKQLLGHTGGKIMESAQTAAHDTLHKVQNVAGRVVEEVGHVAADAAKEEGLTS